MIKGKTLLEEIYGDISAQLSALTATYYRYAGMVNCTSWLILTFLSELWFLWRSLLLLLHILFTRLVPYGKDMADEFSSLASTTPNINAYSFLFWMLNGSTNIAVKNVGRKYRNKYTSKQFLICLSSVYPQNYYCSCI